MDPTFAALLAQFADIFQGVDFGLLVQRAIVGATILTFGWFGYRYFVRPPGSLYWLRSEAHRLTAVNRRLSAEVARDEGVVDGLRTHLHLIVSGGHSVIVGGPPSDAHLHPPDKPPSTA